MEIPAKYSPLDIEDKWYSYWMKNNFFHSSPDDREPYVIVIPPPNVTGVLHMGHMLNNTIQDVLVRRARMLGKNACWVPGTDHASIATEAKVVTHLKDKGIQKWELTRDQFLEHAWEWKEKHGGIILEQLKKLGASCDWERTAFTMDPIRSESVINVFTDLYNKGLIYRGLRMINWDPSAKTSLSDEEVYHNQVQSKLYYLNYQIDGSDNEWITIATTRPETILGDTAICVNPADERYLHLTNKKVVVPLIGRVIPVIFDTYVEMEFGTGCLKVTPAHDFNDYDLGLKHKLEIIDIFNEDGTMSNEAQLYIGKDRFEVRKQIVKDLEKAGNLVKIEEYTNNVGYSERTHVVVEPRLSQQWFLKMKDLSKPALEAVMSDEIQLIPSKFKNTYNYWMANVRDWCISRQLWWGHRIPAFYLKTDSKIFAVADTIQLALELLQKKTNNNKLQLSDLQQDEDVLDTWFSAWLWPISVFDGIRNPENEEINYYYPSNDLVTAPEILFFWVARMVIAGYEYKKEMPFKNVYLTGIVRDKQGRKMSKSLGNSPDPIELIQKYGADGVRVGMLLCSPAGNDLPFDESLTEQGRNFSNKIWNAFRLVQSWNIDPTIEQPNTAKIAIEWFESKLNQTINEIIEHFDSFRLSDALMSVYKLFWDEFSAWYLEMIKPGYGLPIDSKSYEDTLVYFDKLIHLLHPFMPFITEEIWHYLAIRKDGESIMMSQMPIPAEINKLLLADFEQVKDIISKIRSVRQEKNIAFKESLNLSVKTDKMIFEGRFNDLLKKQTNLTSIIQVNEKPSGAAGFMVGTSEFYIPLLNLIDVSEELDRLTKELEYQKGFLISVSNKLENERFVSGAPVQVLETERKKKADAEAKINAIEEQIKGLK